MLVLVATAALQVVAVVLGSAARPGRQPIVVEPQIDYVFGAAISVGYGFVFALLVSRGPRNRVGWLFGGVALAAAIASACWAYVANATETIPPRLPSPDIVAWIGGITIPAWVWLIVTLIAIFPDDRAVERSWRWLHRAKTTAILVAMVGIGFGAEVVPIYGVANPFVAQAPLGTVLRAIGLLAFVAALALLIPAGWALLLRYRAADRSGRLQLKWFTYSALLFAVVVVGFLAVGTSAQAAGSSVGWLVWLAVAASATFIPIAASVAILHYRLYGIDSIIGRTFVYAALTAILAGLYAAGIRAFNWLFVEVTGESSDAALVLTTLVLATTFTPIKTWLERIASKRLKEPAELTPAPRFDMDDPEVLAFAQAVASMARQGLEPTLSEGVDSPR